MPDRRKIADAVILLPAADAAGPVCAWLARARWERTSARGEALRRVLHALDVAAPPEGLAALRRWGQCGAPPEGWICGADPVYLEPRLDHLCLFRPADVSAAALAAIATHLQAALGGGGDVFSAVDGCGYLARGRPMATAAVSAETVHGTPPDAFLPTGPAAAGHDRLQSEVQMCLHDAPVNDEREAAGLAPVNALWFWGGGAVPRPAAGPLPPLFGDDPLLRGYWFAAGADAAPWPGSLDACLEAGAGSFVAVVPPAAGACLPGLRRWRRRFGRLVLLFPDGRRAELCGADRWRIWRRALPPAAAGMPGTGGG